MGSDSIKNYIDIVKANEAVIDEPSEKASNLFDENGKIAGPVKSTIFNVIRKIQQAFPQAKMIDYFVVGSGVTAQHRPDSDIDTTLVYAPDTPEEVVDSIYSYARKLEKETPHYEGRPFQFTPSLNGRDKVSNADAAYDIKNDTWIKRPDLSKVKSAYGQIMDPEGEAIRKYKVAERSIQPVLQMLNAEIQRNGLTDRAKDLIKKANERYSKIKDYRSSGYAQGSEHPISQNWNTQNIIFKFLDAEGYIKVFKMLSKFIANNFKVNNNDVNSLSNALNSVASDEIGFVRESKQESKPGAFKMYIDIVESQKKSRN